MFSSVELLICLSYFLTWNVATCIFYMVFVMVILELLLKNIENVSPIEEFRLDVYFIKFTRHCGTLNYSLMGKVIPQRSSCKYLEIILCSDLSWADQVNYTVKKAWKALHFTIRILKKGNSNTRSLAYRSLVRPILEYGAACWDPYREGQIKALDRVQKT